MVVAGAEGRAADRCHDMPPPPELHSSVFEGTTLGRHSAKPDSVRDWISEAYPDAGKIELYARTAAPGWVTWGNESLEGEQLVAPRDPCPPWWTHDDE